MNSNIAIILLFQTYSIMIKRRKVYAIQVHVGRWWCLYQRVLSEIQFNKLKRGFTAIGDN